MRAYIVRHSVPEPAAPDDDDPRAPDPPLTDEGRAIVKALAAWMLEQGEVPNFVVSSPALRTQETAEILRDELGLAAVRAVASIGPRTSIRSLMLELAGKDDATRVLIVSHHESIGHGLVQLNDDPAAHWDMFAQGELRILKIRRKDGSWKEKKRVLPSELGGIDHY